MKLGATITSERGRAIKKTGNEYLNIEININGEVIGTLDIDQNYSGGFTGFFKPVERSLDGSDDKLIVLTNGIAKQSAVSETNNENLKHDKKWEDSECLHCGPRKDLQSQGLVCPHK